MNNGKPKEDRFFPHGELILTIKASSQDPAAIKKGLLANPLFAADNPFSNFLDYASERGIPEDHQPALAEGFGRMQSDMRTAIENIGSRTPILSKFGEDEDGFSTANVILDLPSPEDDTVSDDLLVIYAAAEITFQARPGILDQTNALTQAQQEAPVKVLSASPNWYFAPGQGGGIITGGPGTKPIPTDPDDEGFTPSFEFLPAGESGQMTDIPSQLTNYGEMPAHAIILDTIPGKAQIDQAKKDFKKNQTLQSLLSPGVVNRHYYPHSASDPGFQIPPDKSLQNEVKGHDYNMSDHGLFIAGLVYMLAPTATIDLVEVLNNRGVGTMNSLVWGLNKARQLANGYGKDKTVVNCSLMFGFDPDVEQAKGGSSPIVQLLLALWQLFGKEIMELLLLFELQEEFSGAKASVDLIIAAAGNDRQETNIPETRYPASLSTVIGVGALGSDNKIAPYSNKADKPEGAGLWVFGGDANSVTVGDDQWKATDTSLLSIYTDSSFPDGAPNNNGWARAAGTSYASGVIAGILARLISHGMTGEEAKTFLQELVVESAGVPVHMVRVIQT